MRKLFISIMMFIVMLVLLTTTTLAWISLASVNSVKDISLGATTGYDLDMSLDGINYFSSEESIPKEELLKLTSKVRFKDITSSDGKYFERNLYNTDQAKKNQDYISLDFHFRTSSRYQEIHLSDNILNADYDNPPKEGTYITSKGLNFKSPYTFKYGPNEIVHEGEVRKYFAKDAMRVSFVDNENQKSKIFDLSGNEERGFCKNYGSIDYLKKSNNKYIDIPNEPETIYQLSTFSTDTPYATSNNSLLTTLKLTDEVTSNNRPYYKGSVTMNIWLEGFDADAFDAIHGDQIKMQFMFRAVFPNIDNK